VSKNLISIVTACFNEEDNVKALYEAVKKVFNEHLPDFHYEHLFIDNASTDDTVKILKNIAEIDKNVKIIINSRNFGHVRSPVYGILQAKGNAVISIVADFQDPPEMIPLFIEKWLQGNDTVLAIKKDSLESKSMFKIRKLYYKFLSKISEIKIYKNYTGFGLYDKKVINSLKSIQDPYPFFRGMISEVGFKVALIDYTQPARMRGITKNNFYTLYDMGILGLINNSKIPLRFLVFLGFTMGFLSLIIGLGYLVTKLIFWNKFSVGIAPLIIGGSLAFSFILFFLGIIGEYIGAIYTQVLNRPLVFEQERINFD
jgi:glycosyltransferase involved in cell wall biosynthesis